MLQPTDPPQPADLRRNPVTLVVDWVEDPRRRARRAEKRRRKQDAAPGYEYVRRPAAVEPRRCETCGCEIPAARLRALPEATQCLDCKRVGDAASSRSWNLRELERLAREHGGRDVAQDEERRFLLLYLGDLADADGNLSPDFDGLVRESFLAAVATRE